METNLNKKIFESLQHIICNSFLIAYFVVDGDKILHYSYSANELFKLAKKQAGELLLSEVSPSLSEILNEFKNENIKYTTEKEFIDLGISSDHYFQYAHTAQFSRIEDILKDKGNKTLYQIRIFEKQFASKKLHYIFIKPEYSQEYLDEGEKNTFKSVFSNETIGYLRWVQNQFDLLNMVLDVENLKDSVSRKERQETNYLLKDVIKKIENNIKRISKTIDLLK